MVAVAAAAVVLSACSVAGEPERAVDLHELMVPAADFPYGPATPLPAQAVPGALSDITMRPLRDAVDPARCTPAEVDAPTAQISVGPGGEAHGTLTVLLARSGQSLDEYVQQNIDCAEFLGGSTGNERIATQIVDSPAAAAGQSRAVVLRRTLSVPGSFAATVIDEWMAQRGDVRVYVQNRHTGGALSESEQTSSKALFDAAVQRAFG
ncbi:MAG: hypothetical protein QM658_13855 [Gordonia sp. (in: high G+C Gram-positive bacteria)]